MRVNRIQRVSWSLILTSITNQFKYQLNSLCNVKSIPILEYGECFLMHVKAIESKAQKFFTK